MWKSGLFILLFSFPTWAYKLTQDFTQGFYWASIPISITVVESDADRKSTIEKLAEDAIGEWEARTGLSLWNFDSGSKNIIRWSTNFAAETKMDPVTVLAVAIRHTLGPYFARTEIVINGGHPLNHDLTHLLTTLTHELGHTMGLDHSEHYEAVMAPTLQDPYRGLHSDDIKGINYTFKESTNRQLTKFISPLAYEKVETSSQPLGCGTVGIVGNSGAGSGGMLSLGLGMLMGFVRKIYRWFKSLL
ncbi:MAG TPA: matrixin family metalloprotease [Bacteriovoracaceae bacterium]|nr:matrixin family metalloprotease [Bacteriovoracaceae bacterium]